MDITQTLEEQIASALLEINPNTTTAYPQAVWTGAQELALPVTVYTLDTATVETRARAEARVRLELHVDTFARSRAEAGETAAAIRAAMLEIFAECSSDRTYDAPAPGLVRRAQTFRGVLHTGDMIVYQS